jgi:hypothetical protein
MASIIRIKRSSVSGNPSTLGAGELAYSALADNGSNGGDRLYIGMGAETAGNAASHVVIGGKFFTDMVSAATNLNTASTLVKRDASGNFIAGTITATLTGNADTATKLATARTIAFTGDATASGSFDGSANYSQALTLATVNSNVGQYGSATSIPVITVNAKGLVTAVSTAAISTTLNIAAGTGTAAVALGTDTLTFTGGSGITTTASKVTTADTLTIGIDTTVVATLNGSQTLANKTLTAPTINGGTHTGITNLAIRDTSAAYDVTIGATSSTTLTAGRALTLDMVNGARTVKLGGNLSLAGDLSTSGAFGVTLTATATTNVTLPTTGTLATLAGSETLTNKTLTSPVISTIVNTGTLTLPTSTDTLVGRNTTDTLTNKTLSTGSTWNGNTVGVGYGGTGSTNGSITGTGALTFTAGGTNNNVNLVPVGTGTVDAAGFRITSVGTPTQSTDAATKGYVDAVKQALDIKDSVRLATTGNLTVTASGTGAGKTLTNAGTQAVLTLDSVPAVVGDRILVKDQTTAANNGIYTVTNIGSVSTNWVLTRATDADNSAAGEVTPGMFTFVEEGTVNQDSGWVLTTDGSITIDSTALNFVQFSGAGQVIAGAGLTKTGNTLDVVGTANRILVNADSIDIASTYVGQSSITTLGTVTTGQWNATLIAPTYGGTGVNNGTNTLTLGGNVTHSGAYTQTFTATGNTNVTLPTTGTLATLAGSESLTNKTIDASNIGATTRGTGAFTTLAANGAVTLTSTTDATALGTAAVVLSGGLSVAKNAVIGQVLYIGSGAPATSFTNAQLVTKGSGSTYAQVAIVNTAATGSADYSAYADNGTDSAGWADMGMTGSTFSDTNYTITGKNDGYFFVQAVTGSGLSGNMVFATGGNGTTNDIVWGTGGFLAANEKMRFVHATGTFNIKTTTTSSSTSTGALVVGGGVGVAGNINLGGNLTGAGASSSALDGFTIDGGTY